MLDGRARLRTVPKGRADGERRDPWDPAWRRDAPAPESVADSFFCRNASEVARDLLGMRLVSNVGGAVEGVIVETEAYVGPEDPASHAAERIGRTERNEAMFGEPGTFYVYRSHGIHHCVNVVTDRPGFPSAVLIRALEPRSGLELMMARRGREDRLCAGPGNLARALGITMSLNGVACSASILRLRKGWAVPEEALGISTRIGISRGKELPLRFFVRGHEAVKPPRW